MKLRADKIWGMLAVKLFKTLCLPVCYSKTVNIKINETVIPPALCGWGT
jgi:hypothetical protein